MTMQYVRTDRNGTKIYHDYTCPKCGGTGHIPGYDHIEGGVCFKCGGQGTLDTPRIHKEYTPEYAAKLEARRKARFEKKCEEERAKAAEINAKFYEKNGFSPEGKTFIVIGNTYKIKDELKAMGAKWDNGLNNFAGYGWHLPQDTDRYPTVEADVNEMYPKDYAGRHVWNNWELSEKLISRVEKAVSNLNREQDRSEYVGNLKQRLDINLIYTGHSIWDNPYSYYDDTHLYRFEDAKGNQLVWKTSKCISEFNDDNKGKQFSIKATVKDHSEYKGKKQTVLTRCKIIK